MTARAVGGSHRFDLGDEVYWGGTRAKVIALTVEPSVTIEFDGGSRLTVGQSVLRSEAEGSAES